MEDWKECKLSEIGTIVGGATPSTKDISNYENGTIAWITPKDLSTFTERFISYGERNITEKGLKSCSAQIMPKHSVLFTSRAPIGYIAISNNEVCTNQGFKSIIPNKNTDYMFLYYLLKFSKDKIEGLGSGTTFKEVSGSTMKNFSVKIPPLPTQQKIAQILSSLDDKIELNNKINVNLEQQAQALFKSWFVDFEPFGGKMPAGWKMGVLSDIAKISAGGDKPKETTDKKSEDYSIPIYSNGLDNFGLYGFTNKATVFEESVTVSARGTIGFVCLRVEPYVPIVRLISVIPNCANISAKYLYLSLKNRNIAGTTQQQLTVPAFSKEDIVIPTETLMTSFTNLVEPIFSKIFELRNENEKLSNLRDTLLPKLMNGEIEV